MIEATVRVGVTDEGEIRLRGFGEPSDFMFDFGQTTPATTATHLKEWVAELKEAEDEVRRKEIIDGTTLDRKGSYTLDGYICMQSNGQRHNFDSMGKVMLAIWNLARKGWVIFTVKRDGKLVADVFVKPDCSEVSIRTTRPTCPTVKFEGTQWVEDDTVDTL